jgi:hypothetical protein
MGRFVVVPRKLKDNGLSPRRLVGLMD